MSGSCIDRIGYYLKDICKGKAVLEVGSKDGYYRMRKILNKSKSYTGIDINPGKAVDIVCDAKDIKSIFQPEMFDIVVSTNVLEHVKEWQKAISGIKYVCKKGGIVAISVPYVFPYHKDPEDYWRYSLTDLNYIFADFLIDYQDIYTVDASKYGGDKGQIVIIIGIKPEDFNEIDLSNYDIIPTNTDKSRR